MLLRNIRLAYVGGAWKENLTLSVIDGKISYEQDKTGEVLDCSNYILLPGLTNGHTHAAMSLFRGYEDHLPLQRWLEEKIWPAEAKLKPAHIYAGALLACAEMIKYGTVHFNDMYFHEDQTARAAKQLGMKADLAEAIADFLPGSLARAERTLRASSQNIKFLLGPHAVYTCSQETLEKVAQLSARYGCGVHIHVSETKKELEDCIKERGKSPLAYLEELGLLSNTLAAHCCWLSESDIGLLKKVTVAHCPSSNLKLVSGRAPIEKIGLERIRIGTDSVASNNCLNLFAEAKLAALLSRSVNPENILLRLFYHGLSEGSDADFILINSKNPNLLPLNKDRIASHLIFSFSDPVDFVCIGGKIVLREHKLVNIDMQDVFEIFNKAVCDLFERI